MKYLAVYQAVRSSNCREEEMLPALEYGVHGYDTVPANQASYDFLICLSVDNRTTGCGKELENKCLSFNQGQDVFHPRQVGSSHESSSTHLARAPQPQKPQ